MVRTAALAVATCFFGMPAAAVTVILEFEAIVDRVPLPFQPFTRPAAADTTFIVPPFEPVGPSSGDAVSGRITFDIDDADRVRNVSGSAPIAGADPALESATVSTVERVEGCKGDCVTIDPPIKPLVPSTATVAQSILAVEYGPNTTFTDPTFDSSIEWLDLSILVAADIDGDPSPPSVLSLLQLPGALPVAIEYTRISRGMIFIPGVDRDNCALFGCATFGATVTSGSIRVSDAPAPIPLPPAVASLLAALGALSALRRSAKV